MGGDNQVKDLVVCSNITKLLREGNKKVKVHEQNRLQQLVVNQLLN